MATPTISGHADPKFDALKAVFQAKLDSGDELGAAITVNIDGTNVVDIWGGFSDAAKSKPWDKDTIVNVFSSTKTIISLATFLLIDRGLVDPDAPVAKYWPEFAANGKENVKVRHIMSHTSGLSGWEDELSLEDIYDFEATAARLAAQAPWWEPGTASGYHAITMGFLLGELVRRVTGLTMTQFVEKEIAGPLGADIQIGCKDEDLARVTDLIPLPNNAGAALENAPVKPPFGIKTFLNPIVHSSTANSAAWRKAELGAANGHTNARGINRALSVITLGGEVDGVRLLSQKTIDRIFEEQSNGPDLVIGIPLQFGMGYSLPESPYLQDMVPAGGRIAFWGGYGGSLAIMDLDRRMTFTYTMNRMQDGILGTPTGRAYIREVYKALGVDLPPPAF